MPAYELFAATTTNGFIENIKTKAEAYGWTIDYYAAGRAHLHNIDGAHFELYTSGDYVGIRGCSGYDSGAGSSGQPNVSGQVLLYALATSIVIIGVHAIFIKSFAGAGYHNLQFGCIVDKIGSWAGGWCISYAHTTVTSGYSCSLWGLTRTVTPVAQVYINGGWSASTYGAGASVVATSEGELSGRMPFAYSGGILPVPFMLLQCDPVTTAYLHPIGYAPDAMRFYGGSVYRSFEEIDIDGAVWVGLNEQETNGGISGTPNLLIRIAS